MPGVRWDELPGSGVVRSDLGFCAEDAFFVLP